MDESLSESHLKDIREGKDRDAGSMKTLFTTHWRSLLLVFLITAGGTVAFYTYSVNAPAIVKSTFGTDRAMTATWINLLGLIFLLLLQPVGGIISDRVGRKPLLIFFGVGGVIYTYFLLTFLPQTTSPLIAFALTAVGYVILTGYTSVNAIVKAEFFPADIRALGVGLGYALANSVFGGTAPLLFQASKSADHISLVHRLRHGGDRREPAGLHLRAEEQGDHGARSRAGERLGCACHFGRPLSRPHRLDEDHGNRIRNAKDTAIADGRIPLSHAGRDGQPAGAPSNTWPRTAPGRPGTSRWRAWSAGFAQLLSRHHRYRRPPDRHRLRHLAGTAPGATPRRAATGERCPCVSASEEMK